MWGGTGAGGQRDPAMGQGACRELGTRVQGWANGHGHGALTAAANLQADWGVSHGAAAAFVTPSPGKVSLPACPDSAQPVACMHPLGL